MGITLDEISPIEITPESWDYSCLTARDQREQETSGEGGEEGPPSALTG